jgi:hypothetical protein
VSTLALAAVLVLLPAVALACPSCVSAAYGDRTFNWAFGGLLAMPFVVACGIGGVLTYLHIRRGQPSSPPPGDHRPDQGGPHPRLEETT